MKTIWKFPMEVVDRQDIAMPEGAEVLAVGVQGVKDDILVLWAKVDPNAPSVDRHFAIIGTGRPAPEDADSRYIGTVQFAYGLLVWHIFEQAT